MEAGIALRLLAGPEAEEIDKFPTDEFAGADAVMIGVIAGLNAEVLISIPTTCIPLDKVDTRGNINICGPRTVGVGRTKGLTTESNEVEFRTVWVDETSAAGKV